MGYQININTERLGRYNRNGNQDNTKLGLCNILMANIFL